MARRRPISKLIILSLTALIAYLSIVSLLRAVKPSLFVWSEEDLEEAEWLASSQSWWDRKFCRFFGLCGIAHVRLSRAGNGAPSRSLLNQLPINSNEGHDWRTDWLVAEDLSANWTSSEKRLREIPGYVLEYAPLVHLYSGETFWPGDIAEHLVYTTPTLNYTPVQSKWNHPTLEDLNRLNQWDLGRHVYLTSDDDVEVRPDWLLGERNIPVPLPPNAPLNPEVPDGHAPLDSPVLNEDDDWRKWYDAGSWEDNADAHSIDVEGSEELDADSINEELHIQELRKRYGGKPVIVSHGADRGRSDAPAMLVIVDKGNDIIDAFWFFFYSYNLGNTVLDVRFGNHVGDWEHTMIRFYKGHPKALFLSAHTAGEAYSYDAIEKQGKRPIVYSATGTHAMYASPGIHEYVLPWGLLHDTTDRGPLWDPVLNSKYYTYDYLKDELYASDLNPSAPTEWFFFNGRWGDKFYPLGDPRQYRFAGQYHYVNGPLGPRFKHLGRRKVCQGRYTSSCVVRNFAAEEKHSKRGFGLGVGDEPEDEDLSVIMSRRTEWLMMMNEINADGQLDESGLR